MFDDRYWMEQALSEAADAYAAGEIPVGAVMVCQDRIIARGHNQTELLRDVTAHAEMLVWTAASDAMGSKYLPACTLYVTLEPCVMCAGALAWGQLGRLVYGASDPKRGYRCHGPGLLHPRTQVSAGVSEQACGDLLVRFFKDKR
ncbi:MAG: hypothetical protein RLY31_2263 [Bacteroidota bacterium]